MRRVRLLFSFCLILAFFSQAMCACGQDVATEDEQPPAGETGEPSGDEQPAGEQTTSVTGEEQTETPSTVNTPTEEQISEESLGEQTDLPETPPTEQSNEGTVSVEATVTITPVENPIVQNLHTESGVNYVKRADGKLYDPLGNEVSWTAAGQLLDDDGSIVEPPTAETILADDQGQTGGESQPTGQNEDFGPETSDTVTTADPVTVTDPVAPLAEIKEATIEQDVATGQYTDTETGERIDVADLSQSVVIEANNQAIDVAATVEIIDQVATAIVNGEQSIVVIGDGNFINVIANILAAVSDLFVDWSQIVHVHGENNVVNTQVNVNAQVQDTAQIHTETRLEINLPKEVPPEVIQSIISVSYGTYGNSPSAQKPATPEISELIDVKMNEVLYQETPSIIEGVEFINTGETNQTYFIGVLKLRFVNIKTGEVNAIVDLAANPDPTNPNHVIIPGEIKVKDLTGINIPAMDVRIDLIGYFNMNGVKVIKIFDSMECTWSGIREARARQYGMSVEVSEARNPDGNGEWDIMPRTKGRYNNPHGHKSELFANARTENQIIAT